MSRTHRAPIGALRKACWDSRSNGWVGTFENGFRTDWGEKAHLKWTGQRELKDVDGRRMPSIRWGTEHRDPSRIMYLDSGGVVPRGYEIYRTCDFHTYRGGDPYCMNVEHMKVRPMLPPDDELIRSIDRASTPGHWMWLGATVNDYGKTIPVMYYHGRMLRVRILAYNKLQDNPPDPPLNGISHMLRKRPSLCSYDLCVNPDCHSPSTKGGPFTGGGRKPATVCKRGHPLTDPKEHYWLDKLGHKHCKICARIRMANWRDREVEKIRLLRAGPEDPEVPRHMDAVSRISSISQPLDDDVPDLEDPPEITQPSHHAGRKPATVCKRGHPLLEEQRDFWLDKYNRKHCRECNRLRGVEFREKAITGKNPGPSPVPLTERSGLFRLDADLAELEEPTNGSGGRLDAHQVDLAGSVYQTYGIDERALQEATDELTALLGF